MRRTLLLAAAAFALLLAILGTAALLLRSRPSPERYVQARVGQVNLAYPAAYARFSAGQAGGPLSRLELAFHHPGLKPAGDAAVALASDDAQSDAQALVFLTVRPQDQDADPAERTNSLYSRFLQSDVWQEDNGLVMRRFEAGSPYASEELHFVPPDGRSFAARCIRPTQPPSDLPSTCLATIRVKDLDVDLRFPPVLLPHWEVLTEGARRLVESLIVP